MISLSGDTSVVCRSSKIAFNAEQPFVTTFDLEQVFSALALVTVGTRESFGGGGGCHVRCKIISNVLDLYALDANSTHTAQLCSQKYLQTRKLLHKYLS